jgi:hypothetical protein
MDYHSLTDIFGALDETRRRLYDRLEGLSSDEEKRQDGPDSWSVGQVAEHLAIMEERLIKLFPIMLTKAASAGAQAASGDTLRRPVSIDKLVARSVKEKYVAPDVVRPSGSVPVADSLGRLQRSRASLLELRPRIETADGTSVNYPHPVFGPLDLYQWLLMIGMHEERHLRQIESLLQAESKSDGASSEA